MLLRDFLAIYIFVCVASLGCGLHIILDEVFLTVVSVVSVVSVISVVMTVVVVVLTQCC